MMNKKRLFFLLIKIPSGSEGIFICKEYGAGDRIVFLNFRYNI